MTGYSGKKHLSCGGTNGDATQSGISQALDIAVACGCRQVVLTTGRRSEKYARAEIHFAEESFIIAGDFIGYSLSECARKPIDRVIIWGMTGKMSKLASGRLYTNGSDSKVDIDFLIDVAAGCGISGEVLLPLKAAVTANHLRRLLPPDNVRCFCNRLCLLAADRCSASVGGKPEITCILSDYNGEILGRSDGSE